jgi:hypothetical protein
MFKSIISIVISEQKMETQSKDLFENPILLQMLTRMGEELEKLEKLPKAVEDLDSRISNLEKLPLKEEPVNSVLPTNSGNSSLGELELKDTKISELESHLAYLESPEYREETILEWLRNLDQELYYALGVRKGYLEEIDPANKPPLGELKDPSPEVIFSDEKPEDMIGWAYSKTLNCYIKLVGGMLE